MTDSAPCIGCGYCCKQSVCGPWGTWTPSGCSELVRDEAQNRYVCAKHNEIVVDPRGAVCPAFGGGCGSLLFNERRRLLATEGRLLY
jgi:Fe-S-cluster containining protein